jgi:hypothetical protein
MSTNAATRSLGVLRCNDDCTLFFDVLPRQFLNLSPTDSRKSGDGVQMTGLVTGAFKKVLHLLRRQNVNLINPCIEFGNRFSGFS